MAARSDELFTDGCKRGSYQPSAISRTPESRQPAADSRVAIIQRQPAASTSTQQPACSSVLVPYGSTETGSTCARISPSGLSRV